MLKKTKSKLKEVIPTVVMVEDHKIIRESIFILSQKENEFQIIGESETAMKGIELVNTLLPDVMLLDVNLPDCSGLEVAKLLRKEKLNTKIIVLTMISEDPDLFNALIEVGVKGYVTKISAGLTEIGKAIRQVMNGEVYYSPEVSRFLELSAHPSVQEVHPISGFFTDRELEILILLSEGNTFEQTANILKISPRTVETHRHRIYLKTRLKNLPSIIRFACDNGYI